MKLDSDSWGPDGLLQLYFPTHLKAALLSGTSGFGDCIVRTP